MYNKISVPNPKYNSLKVATCVLMILALTFAVCMVVLGVINSRNLNGEVTPIIGTVTLVEEGDSAIRLQMDGKDYTAGPVQQKLQDWSVFQNKQVTLYIPQRQASGDLIWILGIEQDGKVLVNYEETLQEKRQELKVSLTILGVIVGVCVLASGVTYTWQRKTEPFMERDLYAAYCDYSAPRQPSCPLYRRLWCFSLGYTLIIVLCMTGLVIFDTLNITKPAKIALCVVFVLLAVVSTVLWFLLTKLWLPKKERQFYARNFPFDFADITHVSLRKKVKEQLQQELKKECADFPHRYGDGGNGFLIDFTKNGVSLSIEHPDEVEFAPSAEEVFGAGGDAPVTNGHVYDFSYDELNFEAVPYFRKRDRSMFIVIKSRLTNVDSLPDTLDMTNDLHIILDTNLLATLRHFAVPVENLDFLLENKAQLIEEHCKHSISQK